MTILQSKSSQQGDSDEAPPKKKLKKGKSLVRSQVPSHSSSHPTTSSAPGPSRRSEQRGRESFSCACSNRKRDLPNHNYVLVVNNSYAKSHVHTLII